MARYQLHHLVIPRSTPRPPAPSPLAELALNLYTKIWFVRPQAKLARSRLDGTSGPRECNCSERGTKPPQRPHRCCESLRPLRSPCCRNVRGEEQRGAECRRQGRPFYPTRVNARRGPALKTTRPPRPPRTYSFGLLTPFLTELPIQHRHKARRKPRVL